MTSVSPERFFSACCFSGKISNYCIFRSNYVMSSFDNMGFVIKDYSTLLRCFSEINTKFSLVIDPAGNHYCGSLSGSKYKKGLIFDKKLNYFTYSDSFHYKGYIRNIEDEVTYFGGLSKKLPNGHGLIVISSKPVFLGNFINGVPSGRGFYFSKREDLNFFGTFHSKPIYGIFKRNMQYISGIFTTVNDDEKVVNFEQNPVTLNNLKECNKLMSTFLDFYVKGECRHFDETIFEIKGVIRYSVKELSGLYDIDYIKGSRFYGYLERGRRSGIGYLISSEGKFQLFGVFDGSSQVRGYMLIDHSGENSAKESQEQHILIPQLIYGNILYDSSGRMHLKGQAKVVLTNGAVYYGQFINNSITGYGRLCRRDSEDSVYTGQIYFGKQYGVGKLETKSFIYEGEFRDDKFHGYGEYKNNRHVVKGFWQNGFCLYANIQYLIADTDIYFYSLNIVFDQPSNNFELCQLVGTIELYYDKASSQILTDIYDEMNLVESEAKLNKSKIFERRGSVHGSNPTKQNNPSKKRKMSIPQRETSVKSVFSYAINDFQGTISKKENKLKRLTSYSKINESIRFDTNAWSRNNSLKLKSRLNISTAKGMSRFIPNRQLRQNTSMISLHLIDLEDHLEKVYRFGGRISKGGRCSGIIRRYADTLAVLESDIGFQEGIIYYSNSSKTEEIYGAMRVFKVTGIATKVTTNCRFIGWFKDNKPDGLAIKTTLGKDKFIGEYRKGFKHGQGLKKSKDDHGRVTLHLFDYLAGELVSLSRLAVSEAQARPLKTCLEMP